MLPLFYSIFLFISLPTQADSNSSISNIATASQIIQDNKGFIWIAGQNGLTRFDGEQVINFSSKNTSWPLTFNWLHDVAIDSEHLLLATETEGLWRFNPKTGLAKKILADIPRKSIYDVISFHGDYYINAPDKLYRYQTQTNVTEIIDNNIKIKEIIHSNKHLYVSSQSGLYQLKNNNLIKILNEPVLALTALSSGVIAITKNSIIRFDDDGSQLSIKKVNSINAATKEFNTNNFFTVTNQGEVGKFSGETLQPILHKFDNIKPIRVRSFLHDNSGVLWLISNRGIEQLTENSIRNHPKVFDIKINANKLGVFRNELIIGSYGAGLQNFTVDIFTPSVNDAFSKNGLRINKTITINDTLYIATFDGLWRYNPENNNVERLNFPENNKLICLYDNFIAFGTSCLIKNIISKFMHFSL